METTVDEPSWLRRTSWIACPLIGGALGWGVQAISAWALAHRYVLAGRLRTGARFAREAIAGCEQLGVRAGVLDATGLLALIEALSDPDPPQPSREESNAFSLGLTGQVHAWTAIARGDTESARTLFTDTADRCVDRRAGPSGPRSRAAQRSERPTATRY